MDPLQLYSVSGVGSNDRLMIDQIELVSELDELQGQWEEATENDMEEVSVNLGLFFDDLRRLVGVL